MATHTFAPWPQTPIPPDDELRLSLEGADFRCQRCGIRYPKTDLNIEPYTNLRVCRNHTLSYNEVKYALMESDTAARVAGIVEKYAKLIADDQAQGLPVPDIFSDIQGITGVTPAPLALVRGGGSANLTLVGIGFTPEDLLLEDSGLITAGAPAVTFGGTNSVFPLTAASGAALGQHELRFNGYNSNVYVQVVAA